MRFVDSWRMPITAAILGAALAIPAAMVDSAPTPLLPPTVAAPASSPMTLTVTSDEPGVYFAVISDGRIDDATPFVTPATFRLEGPELNAVVVPVDVGTSVQVSTERRFPLGLTRSWSGSGAYHLQRFEPTSVTTQSIDAGALEQRLAQSGVSFTGVQFGEGLSCVEPAVWELILEERFWDARSACARLRTR